MGAAAGREARRRLATLPVGRPVAEPLFQLQPQTMLLKKTPPALKSVAIVKYLMVLLDAAMESGTAVPLVPFGSNTVWVLTTLLETS